jgi:tRNA(Arg) A34 adenosine deaminase TadA
VLRVNRHPGYLNSPSLLRRRRSEGRRGRERRALFFRRDLPAPAEVYGGIGEREAAALLRNFFVLRR